ncbi:hypothetical protein CGCVW01_v004131 [Colletotrichum viniferum]|nr:hypothetical protein CGCVW01_v004131 [Colletotrichum viniferum]
MQLTSLFSTMHVCRETETQDQARVGGMYDRNSLIPLRLCAAQHSKTSPPSMVTSGVRLPSCRCTGLWEPLGTKACASPKRTLPMPAFKVPNGHNQSAPTRNKPQSLLLGVW